MPPFANRQPETANIQTGRVSPLPGAGAAPALEPKHQGTRPKTSKYVKEKQTNYVDVRHERECVRARGTQKKMYRKKYVNAPARPGGLGHPVVSPVVSGLPGPPRSTQLVPSLPRSLLGRRVRQLVAWDPGVPSDPVVRRLGAPSGH